MQCGRLGGAYRRQIDEGGREAAWADASGSAGGERGPTEEQQRGRGFGRSMKCSWLYSAARARSRHGRARGGGRRGGVTLR